MFTCWHLIFTSDVGPCSTVAVAKRLVGSETILCCITAPAIALCVDKVNGEGEEEKRKKKKTEINAREHERKEGKKSTNVKRLPTPATLQDAGRSYPEHVRSNHREKKGRRGEVEKWGRGGVHLACPLLVSARASFHATPSAQNQLNCTAV